MKYVYILECIPGVSKSRALVKLITRIYIYILEKRLKSRVDRATRVTRQSFDRGGKEQREIRFQFGAEYQVS